MSVAMLTENSKVVEIADELESFYHVILYNAVRYLASNCTNAGAFIEDFFDTYKERTVSSSVETGRKRRSRKRAVSFYHPTFHSVSIPQLTVSWTLS